MQLNTFLSVKSLICFLFGGLFLLIPVEAMAIYDVTLDPAGALMTRFFGVAMLGLGFICFSVARKTQQQAIRGILSSLFITDTLGFIVALQLQFSGLANVFGWSVVLIWFVLALGLGYFRFVKSAESLISPKEPHPM